MPSLIVKGRRALKSFTDYWTCDDTPINNKIDRTELVEPEDVTEPDQEQLYIVEKLVDKCKYWNSRLKKMVVMYQVKWLGYAEEENTWATVEELAPCAKESIEQFEQQRAVIRKARY